MKRADYMMGGRRCRWGVLTAFVVTLCCPRQAVAQDLSPAPPPRAAPVKSEGEAFRRSLWGTVLPVAVGVALTATGPTNDGATLAFLAVAGGMALGPSLGHFYAGQTGRALAMTAARAGVITGSFVIALSACPLEDCTSQEEKTAVTSFLAGATLVTALAIYDIATARASVRAYNRRLSLQPWIPSTGGVGISATVRF
jgi:hypothetical protein